MANVLGNFSPIFYAQEGLIQLWEAMGMARRVHMGFDRERATFKKGSIISIKRPSDFTVQDAPGTAEDIDVDTVDITLDQWKTVKFKLSDKEYAYTGQNIIDEHIIPAALRLANQIDLDLNGLYSDIPWYHDLAAAGTEADVVDTMKIAFDNKVPTEDMANMHFEVSSAMHASLLKQDAFTSHQGSGDVGVAAQIRGQIAQRYGCNFFANQNVPTHTKGTSGTTAVLTNGAIVKGATSVNLDAGTLIGTVVPGDVFSIAGQTQQYAVTNSVTASGNAMAAVTFTPPLTADVSDGTSVTLELDTHTANMLFHKNAFALAFAKLPDLKNFDNQLGAQVASVQDPRTGLALRARVYYVGDDSEIHVALDALYGKKTLDPNLAVRARG